MHGVQCLFRYPFNIHFIINRPPTPKFYKWSSVVCFLLGNFPASEFYMSTFRNTLFHLYRRVGVELLVILHLSAYEDGTKCSETSAYKIQTPGNYPEESIQLSEHGESLISSGLLLQTLQLKFFLFLSFVIRPVHLVFLWLDYAKNIVFRAEYKVRISWLCSLFQPSVTSSRLRPLSKSKYSPQCPFLKNQLTFPANATENVLYLYRTTGKIM
jgi:hypothetical protein